MVCKSTLYLPQRDLFLWTAVFFAGSLGLGYVMTNIHIWLQSYFKEPASYAYLDASTTVASFIGNYLMARRRIEAWQIWVLVNVVGIWLYYQKGVIAVSVLYVIFLVFAFKGLWIWKRLADGRELKGL